jgi:hypothetical protein
MSSTDTNQASEVKRNPLNKSDEDVKLEPMTNQASEDELREQLADKLEWYSRYRERGQDDDMDRAFDDILALIRTEKLKLLAEVRERVVGEDKKPTGSMTGLITTDTARNELRAEMRNELTKLEAEL